MGIVWELSFSEEGPHKSGANSYTTSVNSDNKNRKCCWWMEVLSFCILANNDKRYSTVE